MNCYSLNFIRDPLKKWGEINYEKLRRQKIRTKPIFGDVRLFFFFSISCTRVGWSFEKLIRLFFDSSFINGCRIKYQVVINLYQKDLKMTKTRLNFFCLTESTNCNFPSLKRKKNLQHEKVFTEQKITLIDNKLKANSSSCAWAIKFCQHLRRVIYHEQQQHNSVQFLNICKKWWCFCLSIKQ